MQNLMLGLDRFVKRRRVLILVAWAAALVAALPFAAQQSDHLSGGGFSVPGSQSRAVQQALAAEFPQVPRTHLAAVLVPERGAGAGELRAAVQRVDAAAEKVARVDLPARVRAQALAAARRGGTVVVPLHATVGDDAATDVARDLREQLAIAHGPRAGVATHLVGQGALWAGLQELSKDDLAQAETTGFPLVLLILLAVFGSFAAAALPLALGFVSVLVTGALIYALSLSMSMSVFVTNMASMIGIGVAVDYSLFVLARYREEIAAGQRPEDARAVSMATSGLAVVFSGMTVIVSLAGLWMIPNNAIRSMALGAILVVAVSVLASATLLPALVGVLGRRAYGRSRLFAGRSRRRRKPTGPDFWTRWTRIIVRRPVLAVVVAGTLLLVAAIPTLNLHLGSGALRQFPAGHETRVGFEAAARETGPGAASPVQVVARLPRGADRDAVVKRLRAALGRERLIGEIGAVEHSRDGRSVLLTAIPKVDAESDAAKAMALRLRDSLPAAAGAGTHVKVGGISAAQQDITDLIEGSMWKILLFVLGLSYVVLMVLLRSVVLPLKAVLMNLLSVGAAYGVLVATFQYGWFDGLGGFESTGHIDTLTPPLVLAVVFGLSMDYEVFLLSRIRERYEATGDTRTAVAQGLAASARTITSAALIMVAVFAVFVGTGVPSIKQIGLGCAVAIALDATLVRLVLVPAAMELLGRWNWYLPRPLARLLPRGGFEAAPQAAG